MSEPVTDSYTFGPVPSRRLGRSLGVDLVPLKTCPYDCVYCQLGRTTCKTVERRQWKPLEGILEEVKRRLDTRPDYITLSGSGEPTLFTPIDRLIDGIRAMTDAPIAVLTNGSLLDREDVQRELLGADLVVPSLDGGSDSVFQRVNRPHRSLSFERMLDGLVAFRRKFTGQYWLEVFLLDDVAADPREMEALVRAAARIRPDRVQLNTVTRPPAESWAVAVSLERMAELAAMFSPPAEVIAEFPATAVEGTGRAGREEILQMLLAVPVRSTTSSTGWACIASRFLKTSSIWLRNISWRTCLWPARTNPIIGQRTPRNPAPSSHENCNRQRQRRHGQDHRRDQPGLRGCRRRSRRWPISIATSRNPTDTSSSSPQIDREAADREADPESWIPTRCTHCGRVQPGLPVRGDCLPRPSRRSSSPNSATPAAVACWSVRPTRSARFRGRSAVALGASGRRCGLSRAC